MIISGDDVTTNILNNPDIPQPLHRRAFQLRRSESVEWQRDGGPMFMKETLEVGQKAQDCVIFQVRSVAVFPCRATGQLHLDDRVGVLTAPAVEESPLQTLALTDLGGEAGERTEAERGA